MPAPQRSRSFLPPLIRARVRATALATGVAVAATLAVGSSATATPPSGVGAPVPAEHTRVEYSTGPNGHPRHTEVPRDTPRRLNRADRALSASEAAADGTVTPIVRAGPVADKLDVVFVGDGYTASQLDAFRTDVRTRWSEISAVEPYASYRGLFNVWSVDAVSHQSGVSGDPARSTVKDTALDGYFWCGDVERLLCVNTDTVESYAARVADADLVIVLANSTKYGGAGYHDITSGPGYDGIATASSGHPDSDQIAVHETGHSLGKLADEYVYPDYGTYTGDEPREANISRLSAAQLTAQQKKWYRWIGQTSPDGGTVDAYTGGGYYPAGLNRPTQNSIMRTLGREFSLPGREAMIAGFYRHASVLSSATAQHRVLNRTTGLTVSVPPSATVTWYRDGKEVTAERGRTTVTPEALGVPADGRSHTVTAKATDGTRAVRDPELRKLLTESRSWKVNG